MSIITTAGGIETTETSAITAETQALWQPCYIQVPKSSQPAMPIELVSTIRTVFMKVHTGAIFYRFSSGNTIVAHAAGSFVNGASDVTDNQEYGTQTVSKDTTCNLSASSVATITVTAIDGAGGYTVSSSLDLYDSEGFIAIPKNTPVEETTWLQKTGNILTIGGTGAAGDTSTFPMDTAGTVRLGDIGSFKDMVIYNTAWYVPFTEIKVPRGIATLDTDPVYLWVRNAASGTGVMTLIRS